jgi:alkylated DNA repair dioxygenase AlkB
MFQILDWPDGDFGIARSLWSSAEASTLFARLRDGIEWSQHEVVLFGRRMTSPRLSAWHGDPDARYAYSGIVHDPLPWLPVLLQIRARVETTLATRFNAVLANLYRDGRDGMGWHSDNERELGAMPVIASASFGAGRRFALRHRRSGRRESLLLEPGSLLVMAGDSQRCWQHALPKTATACGPRINLTFRYVVAP